MCRWNQELAAWLMAFFMQSLNTTTDLIQDNQYKLLHPLFWESVSRKKTLQELWMTFATSWKLGCRNCRFNHFKVKYDSIFLWSGEAIKLNNQATFLRLCTYRPGVRKICNTITPSWKSVISSQMCKYTMFIEMHGSHLLKIW